MTQLFELREQVLTVARELREEADGSRGSFYEKYGSAISDSLEPLADAIVSLVDSDIKVAAQLAGSIGEYYYPVDTESPICGVIVTLTETQLVSLRKWLKMPSGMFNEIEDFSVIDDEESFELIFHQGTDSPIYISLTAEELHKLKSWIDSPVGFVEVHQNLRLDELNNRYVFIVENDS